MGVPVLSVSPAVIKHRAIFPTLMKPRDICFGFITLTSLGTGKVNLYTGLVLREGLFTLHKLTC